MKSKNRKIKNYSLLATTFCASIVPVVTVVSCSLNDIETQLRKLLKDESLFSVEIDVENIKKVTSKNTVSIGDVFTTDTNTIKWNYSDKLNEWNSNLSEENKDFFTIKPEVRGVVLPTMTNDKKINELEIICDISTGPVSDVIVKKTIDLSMIDNNLLDGKNYFQLSDDKKEIPSNPIWLIFRQNILEFFKTKNISINDSVEDLQSKSRFQFPTQNEGNYVSYQDNLYSSFESKDAAGIWVNIYTSETELETDKIKKDSIAFKLFFSFSDLGLGGK